jgi:hypothetical protein
MLADVSTHILRYCDRINLRSPGRISSKGYHEKEGITMSDQEKFAGFKQKMIDRNEKQYGKEIREKFGDAAVDVSNAKMMGLTAEQYENMQELSRRINVSLKTAFQQGDPSSELAQKVCAWHREWLGYFWNHYSQEAHLGLAQTYMEDPRFRSYYDAIAVGCSEFLCNAIKIYCQETKPVRRALSDQA